MGSVSSFLGNAIFGPNSWIFCSPCSEAILLTKRPNQTSSFVEPQPKPPQIGLLCRKSPTNCATITAGAEPPPSVDLGSGLGSHVHRSIKGQRRKLHASQHPQTKMKKKRKRTRYSVEPGRKSPGEMAARARSLFRKQDERRNQFETFS